MSLLQTPIHCKRSQTTTPPLLPNQQSSLDNKQAMASSLNLYYFKIVFNHVFWTHLFLDPHTRRVTPWTCFILVFQWLILTFVMLLFLMWFLTLCWLALSPNLIIHCVLSRCLNSSTARTFSDVYISTQTPNAVKALWWIGWYFLTVTDTLDSTALMRLQRSKVMREVWHFWHCQSAWPPLF